MFVLWLNHEIDGLRFTVTLLQGSLWSPTVGRAARPRAGRLSGASVAPRRRPGMAQGHKRRGCTPQCASGGLPDGAAGPDGPAGRWALRVLRRAVRCPAVFSRGEDRDPASLDFRVLPPGLPVSASMIAVLASNNSCRVGTSGLGDWKSLQTTWTETAGVIVRPADGRISEWRGLDPSTCFGVSLFRHEIVGYKGHGLVRERVLHLR